MDFALGPKAVAAGWRLDVHATIGSTNAEALRLARSGDCGRLWVVSPHQSAGRGRRGRPWATEPGNLAATALVVVDGAPAMAATLGFVGGLALDEALRRLAPSLAVAIALDGAEGTGGRLRLKWPNDVLLDGRKLAGIGLEAEPTGEGRFAVAVGIGVNVISAPDGLPYPATSLAALGVPLRAADVFAALAEAFAGIERLWDGGRGFEAIRRLWLDRAAGLGAEVVVGLGGEVVRGVFETIDGEGRLVVRGADGRARSVSAGEVHFGAAATVRA